MCTWMVDVLLKAKQYYRDLVHSRTTLMRQKADKNQRQFPLNWKVIVKIKMWKSLYFSKSKSTNHIHPKSHKFFMSILYFRER